MSKKSFLQTLFTAVLVLFSPLVFAANDLTGNPIVIDTAGTTSAMTSLAGVVAISVDPSNTAWAVVLHDAASGNVIFSASNAANEPFSVSFGKGIDLGGLYATTLTNVDRVLIYRQ